MFTSLFTSEVATVTAVIYAYSGTGGENLACMSLGHLFLSLWSEEDEINVKEKMQLLRDGIDVTI